MKILVAYASAHGSTREVAEFIGRILRAFNAEVTIASANDVTDAERYDTYVLGSAIHGGMWLQEMLIFTENLTKTIGRKPTFFWITCIRSLEADGYAHAKRYYFDHKTLAALNTQDTAIFTGRLLTEGIDRSEQWYLVANYDGKLTSGSINHDFRDWETIAGWAISIARQLQLLPDFAQ